MLLVNDRVWEIALDELFLEWATTTKFQMS